jgi:deazaflavin-dependent oxidoreductase (nitroreductase family)
MDPKRKRELIRLVERYLENPPIKAVIALGLPLHTISLIETTGRRTGKRRRNPVLTGLIDDYFWIVADQGRRAGYVRNLEENPDVRVNLGGRWLAGQAEILDTEDPESTERRLGQHLGSRRRFMGRAARLFWTDPLVIRINLGRSG